MKVGDFEYKVNELGHPRIKHNIKDPGKLYKYYSITEFSVQAITNSYLYASHPFDLNDITDSSVDLLHIEERPILSDYEILYKEFSFRLDMQKVSEIYKEDKTGSKYLQDLWLNISSRFGIISMSKNEFSDLMWPHYTSETGFQMEFDTDKLKANLEYQFKKSIWFNPINYLTNRKVLNYNHLGDNKASILFQYITNVKDILWQYENEWRFIIGNGFMGIPFSKKYYPALPKNSAANPAARKIEYKSDCVTGITLGENFINHNQFDIETPRLEYKDPVILFNIKQGETQSEKKNISLYKDLLDYLTSNWDQPIYLTEIIKAHENSGAILKRIKRQVQIKKIGLLKYEMRLTNELFDKNGIIKT